MRQRAGRWRRFRYWVGEFLGENDYARYLQEWSVLHGAADGRHRPLTPREFFGERLRVKYGGGGQRYC